MKVYLVQHGKAKSKEEDPQRGLTAEGIQVSETMAAFLSRSGMKVNHIYHSGKTRALETARFFAEKLKVAGNVAERDGLAPNDEPLIWKAHLDTGNEDTMLVGHLPHLSRLASHLLSGESEGEMIRFSNSGVLCLEREEGKWRVCWMIIPSLLI